VAKKTVVEYPGLTTTRRNDDINLWEAAYRHRLGLGPFYVAVAAIALAGLSAMLTTWQTGLALGCLGAAVGTWVHTRVRDGMRRAYAYVVLVLSLAWIMSAHELFPKAFDWLALTLLAGTVVLGIPWWTSDVKRTQVKIEANLRDWPTVARRIGLEHMKPTGVTMTGIGRKGRFTWPRGAYEVADVLRHKSRIEGAMGAEAGTLRMERDGKSTNSVAWQVVERDPHAAPQPWPLPTHIGRASDPMVLGPREDGEMVRVQRYVPGEGVRSMLIAGQQGSGKSSLINLELGKISTAEDEVAIGFDFKEVELTPWARVLEYMTSSVSEAAELVYAISAEGGLLSERQSILAERGARIWNPAIDGPIITIIVDEAKDLLGMGNAKLVDLFALILTKGRALGVRVVLATQYPTLEAIGSSQIRQQLRHRFCFYMADETGEGFVMPGHRVRADLIDTDRPGTCYFLNGAHLESMPIRILYLDDATVRAVVDVRTGRNAVMDPRSAAAIERLFPGFADRPRYTAEGETDETWTETDGESETGTGSGTAAETDGTAGETGAETEEDDMGEIPAWNEGPDVDLADVIAAHRDRLTDEERDREDMARAAALGDQSPATEPSGRLDEIEAKEAVLRALAEAWPDGVKAKELQRAATRGSSWFYPFANALADEGVVERTKHGTWALVAPPPRAAGAEPEPQPAHSA
jgi:S-DNA-T family DNA segregation ATPase FtsK/SpoIIIE